MQQQYPLLPSLQVATVHFLTRSVAAVTNSFEVHPLQYFLENYFSLENKIIQLKRYAFFWIKRGTGVFTIDLQQYEITKQTIYCLIPGQLMQLSHTDDMEGCYISFSADFFYTIDQYHANSFLAAPYSNLDAAVIIEPDKETQQELEDIVFKINKESSGTSAISSEILKGLFRIFLLYLYRVFIAKRKTSENTRDSDLVTKFMQLVNANFSTKKLVVDYASTLCVSPGYLNQIIKKKTGNTASYHIQQRLIFEAKRQAVHYGKSMKEIAYGLGFDDTAHFSKFFKNISGSSFTNFKKETIYGHSCGKTY